MFNLKDKKLLLTGASGGIGAAIARAFHHQGAHILLTGRREATLQALAIELGAHAHYLVSDLSDAVGAEKLIAAAKEKLGGVDVLINNAGFTDDTLMMRMKDETFQKVLDINLTAPFRLSRSVLKGMMKQRWGRIINISSIVGVTGNPGQANYVASKAGLIGMGKSLAAEIATRGITVNAIAPGFIETTMTDALTDAQKEGILTQIPMRSIGKPEDIASAAIYLASNEAAYITGQTLHINGGMAMI